MLNIVSICSIELFVDFHDSEPYVMIEIFVVSISFQIGLICIHLNYLFLVSTRISCVHAVTLPFRLLIWSFKLFLVLILSPGYLYAFTSSRVCPLSFISDFRPCPHFTALNFFQIRHEISCYMVCCSFFASSGIGSDIVHPQVVRCDFIVHSRSLFPSCFVIHVDCWITNPSCSIFTYNGSRSNILIDLYSSSECENT